MWWFWCQGFLMSLLSFQYSQLQSWEQRYTSSWKIRELDIWHLSIVRDLNVSKIELIWSSMQPQMRREHQKIQIRTWCSYQCWNLFISPVLTHLPCCQADSGASSVLPTLCFLLGTNCTTISANLGCLINVWKRG